MITETTITTATGTANHPNAKILIYAMQHLGYDNHVALCDIIDNSIDANATEIKIYISDKNNNFQIIIQDNGYGMNRQILDEALKFGSNNMHDERSDLGKYGMGLSTAGLSLADRTTVFTRSEEEDIVLKSVTDVEAIAQENAFVKYLGEATEQEIVFFNAQLSQASSGTIVILENCTGVKNKNVTQFSNKLIKEVARKYRKFMDTVDFYVNDKAVAPDDPLMLSGVDRAYISEIFSDDDYEITWLEKKTNTKKIGKVHVKLVILPDTSKEKAKDMGIGLMSQGFSVLRNNREIAYGFMPWFTKHNARNRIRGEISFDASLDEAMGVNFTKNNIDMIDSVDDALCHVLKPQIVAMTNKIKRTMETKPEEKESHTEAEDTINKKAKVLITPSTKNHTEQSKREKAANVRFETIHYGQSGAIFEAEQQGKTTVIRWNVDHPFYARFVRENADNKSLVTSVDFLIYSLATAQIQAIGEDDDKALMIENIISIMSTNMKVLLS